MMAKVAYGLGIMVLARVLVLKNLEVQRKRRFIPATCSGEIKQI